MLEKSELCGMQITISIFYIDNSRPSSSSCSKMNIHGELALRGLEPGEKSCQQNEFWDSSRVYLKLVSIVL